MQFNASEVGAGCTVFFKGKNWFVSKRECVRGTVDTKIRFLFTDDRNQMEVLTNDDTKIEVVTF